MPYVPNERDIKWAHGMLQLLNEEGILAYPATRLTYRVTHREKTLQLLNPKELRNIASAITHINTRAVFEKLGYSVEMPVGTSTQVLEHGRCDFCTSPSEFDAKTVGGPWAAMCYKHFAHYGTGLGLGIGQVLDYIGGK